MTTTRDGVELLIAAQAELAHGGCATCEELRAEIGRYLSALGDLQAYVASRQAARTDAAEVAAEKRARVTADLARPRCPERSLAGANCDLPAGHDEAHGFLDRIVR